MGTWTDLELPKVKQLANATFLDAVRTNIEYLHAPNYAEYQHPGSGGNYTVTGELGQNIDSTNFKLSLTTYGGLIMACFYGQWGISVTSAIRAAIVRTDPVSHLGVNLFNNFSVEIVADATDTEPRGWIQAFPNVPAGVHEFRAIWGVPSGTATLYVANRPYMAVWEI
jgi:hypothetical protein